MNALKEAQKVFPFIIKKKPKRILKTEEIPGYKEVSYSVLVAVRLCTSQTAAVSPTHP